MEVQPAEVRGPGNSGRWCQGTQSSEQTDEKSESKGHMFLRRRILVVNRTIAQHSMFEMLDAAQVESRRRAKRTRK